MATTRKKQSEIKALLAAFGKLILSWNSDIGEMGKLILSVQRLHELTISIRSFMMSKRAKKSRMLHHPHLERKILGKICLDLEGLYKQIKLFW